MKLWQIKVFFLNFIFLNHRRKKLTFSNIVIHPLSPICMWVSVYLFLTSVSCGLTAYEIAFHSRSDESWKLLLFRCILEIFFIMRIIGNFNLAYYDEFGIIVSERKKVIKRYLYSPGGFALDIITTFPFYLFSYFLLDDSEMRYATLAADVRGLQLFRVVSNL